MTPHFTEGQEAGIDGSIWTTTLHRIGGILRSAANEFVSCIQAAVRATNSLDHYEKVAQIIEIETEDPSEYTLDGCPTQINRDVVGQSVRAGIRRGNLRGRAWCQEIIPIVRPESDGTVLGIEQGMANWGSDEPEFDRPTSKGLRSCVPGEFGSTGHATFVEYLTAGGGRPKFYHGYMARQGAFVDMEQARVWSIRKYGSDEENYFVQANGEIGVSGMTFMGRKVRVERVTLSDGRQADALVLV
jgi:hypothetical protein